DPHVAVRIMPVINSQAEFLTKMKDNKGYHMFTFAEEVDSFVKGTKAAGGDKSDLLRIAWDNGKYGQAFKGKGTFKGTISLYYNVLMTGTPAQVLRCYKDVENGMATRVTICEIENQSFASFPVWKKLSKRQNVIIENFVKKCDERTYKMPLDIDLNEVAYLEPEVFKTDVPWRFEYRMHQFIDMTWLKSTIGKWLEVERIKALQSVDFARDTWRKRTAVMGFRLGMICTQLWQNFTAKEQKIAKDFILWWMDREMENALKFFAPAFNSLMNNEEGKKIKHENFYNALPDEFEKSTLLALILKEGLKQTSVRKIIQRWKDAGLIKKVVNDGEKHWVKIKK
ncbi:MAG: hypothetical protein KBS65_03725, partial [Prevotella sp.]|nr:hypothetical protein [Candidatus Equicola stercoris]